MFKKILTLLVLPLGLFILNILVVYPLFKGGYTSQMGSIETAFIADAKFIYEHFPHLSWNPLWYLGFPFHLSYTPFLPYLLAFLHYLVPSLSFTDFYRIIIGLFYALTPVTLYFFVRYLTKKTLVAFISALAFSILPSFVYVIESVRGIGEQFGFLPWRLVVFAIFGEGPHTVSLAFIPLAALAFLYALKNPSLKTNILAAILAALVGLINWIGLVSLVVIFMVILISELILGEAKKKFKNALLIFLITYGLLAFWFNFSFLKSSLGFGYGGQGEPEIFANFIRFWPIFPFLISLAVVGILSVFGKKEKLQALCISSLWFLAFGFVIFAWYYLGRAFLPQGPRYLPELEIGFCLLLGLAISYIVRKIPPVLAFIFVLLVLFLMGYFSRGIFQNSQPLLAKNPDIENTYEYKIAKWLSENTHGERVYLTGSGAFWLNTFTDVPQVRGAADSASTHPWWAHANYQINTSENAPKGQEGYLSTLWLRALNVSYIVVNYAHSQDAFRDYRNPEKFEGILEKVYDNNQGDIVYKVPLKNPSLSQVVDKNGLETLKKPYNAVDLSKVEAYVDWIDEKAKKVEWQWLNNQEAKIRANVGENELVSVQITYDKGWRAYQNGRRLKIKKDVLGNLVVEPRKLGEQEIYLKHKKTWDIWLGYLITILTFGLILRYKRKPEKKIISSKKTKDTEEEEDRNA